MKNRVVVFDLDDTLSKEIDFLKSAYSEIAIFTSKKIDFSSEKLLEDMLFDYNQGLNAFDELLKRHKSLDIEISDLLNIYRNHSPKIKLKKEVSDLLKLLHDSGIPLGMITDGRSKQQRNKINALDLENHFTHIIISEEFGSEKPNLKNYKHFEDIYGDAQYFYIGDNTSKDFISPNKLNWVSICLLDDGRNIHKQNFKIPKEFLPKYRVNRLSEIEKIIGSE